jgi:hypothetical protein
MECKLVNDIPFHKLNNIWELNATIIPTKIDATIVVIFLFTNSSINFLFLVRITSGMIGKGINKLRMT